MKSSNLVHLSTVLLGSTRCEFHNCFFENPINCDAQRDPLGAEATMRHFLGQGNLCDLWVIKLAWGGHSQVFPWGAHSQAGNDAMYGPQPFPTPDPPSSDVAARSQIHRREERERLALHAWSRQTVCHRVTEKWGQSPLPWRLMQGQHATTQVSFGKL